MPEQYSNEINDLVGQFGQMPKGPERDAKKQEIKQKMREFAEKEASTLTVPQKQADLEPVKSPAQKKLDDPVEMKAFAGEVLESLLKKKARLEERLSGEEAPLVRQTVEKQIALLVETEAVMRAALNELQNGPDKNKVFELLTTLNNEGKKYDIESTTLETEEIEARKQSETGEAEQDIRKLLQEQLEFADEIKRLEEEIAALEIKLSLPVVEEE